MAIIDDVKTLKDNIAMLKRIHQDSTTHKYNITLSGRYYTDVNTVLKDYATTKEQIALLLAESGSDQDKLSELVATNNKLNRELLIANKSNKEYEDLLDELITILKL